MSQHRRIRRHLSRQECFAYAESLTGNGEPVSVRFGAHVARCKRCTREVQAIRESLEYVGAAQPIEASPALTARILRAARGAKHEERERARSWARVGWNLARAAACTLLVFCAAVAAFAAVLGDSSPKDPVQATASEPRQSVPEGPSAESIRRTAAEVKSLSSAVFMSVPPSTPEEHKRLRDVSAMDADMEAALSALKRNPGCERATSLVHGNLQRQAETLRDLYTEQTY